MSLNFFMDRMNHLMNRDFILCLLIFNVHVHCLWHSCKILILSDWDKQVWHKTLSVAVFRQFGWCVFRSEPAYSEQSRHQCQEHFIGLPMSWEDLSGQWAARARYELFIVMRRAVRNNIHISTLQSGSFIIVGHFIVHLKSDNVGHGVLMGVENVFELIH